MKRMKSMTFNKIYIATAIFFFAGVLGLSAQSIGIVSSVTGSATYKKGDLVKKVSLGMSVDNHGVISTDPGCTVEVDMDSGSLLTINPGSIFTVSEMGDKEEKQAKRSVFRCVLGSIKCKFRKLKGEKEPYFETNTTVCGVRGTEFSVFSGADGSSIYTVDSGSVEVESKGKSVLLVKDEGVEVEAGSPPGQKFSLKGVPVDFSKKLADSEKAMMADPVGTVAKLSDQLYVYYWEAKKWQAEYDRIFPQIERMRIEQKKIFDSQGKEASQKYQDEIINPVIRDAVTAYANLRHYAMSAHSMRNYLMSKVYIEMRMEYLDNPNDPVYRKFLGNYRAFVMTFEAHFIKTGYLTRDDI